MILHLPAFGICGYSGSGKTTVILKLVRRLSVMGLRVGVIKQDVHGLDVDREGKDSDRFFRAGADVLLRSSTEIFLRTHRHDDLGLEATLRSLAPYYDLLLLEGHKDTPLVEKVWLQKDENDRCPPEAVNIRRVLRRDEDRAGILMDLLIPWLKEKCLATPVYAGILIGGESRRMGQPKHLLQAADGRTWVERVVANIPSAVTRIVLLGKSATPQALAHLPLLPDVADKQGPLAGILAAMRWQPDVSWLFLSCDMPLLTTDHLQWVLSHRAPGVWGVLPGNGDRVFPVGTAIPRRPLAETSMPVGARGAGRPTQPAPIPDGPVSDRPKCLRLEPLPGWYDFRSRRLLETCNGPSALAGYAKILSPLIPEAFAQAWTNVNTQAELNAIVP